LIPLSIHLFPHWSIPLEAFLEIRVYTCATNLILGQTHTNSMFLFKNPLPPSVLGPLYLKPIPETGTAEYLSRHAKRGNSCTPQIFSFLKEGFLAGFRVLKDIDH
jgi:hypothetical protein